MANSIILIQARLSSSRLPAKVILPIHGLPLVVLVAKRASNTGKKAIVCISDKQSDDYLYEILKSYSINIWRGSESDVLKRFNDALVNYNNEDLVFRLTSDNFIADESS